MHPCRKSHSPGGKRGKGKPRSRTKLSFGEQITDGDFGGGGGGGGGGILEEGTRAWLPRRAQLVGVLLGPQAF